MKILLLNQDWFKGEFEAMGHSVVACGADDHFQIRLRTSFVRWTELISLCPWEPEAVVVYDNSVPIFISDLEQCEIPLIFYSVDIQHHLKWQRTFRRFFDRVFVAQKEYVTQFDVGAAPIEWLPLWATHLCEPSDIKRYDAVFVGTMNPLLNPERVTFLNALREKVPLHCTMGEYWHIYPESRVIVNQTVRGDLNFRVFEAMASGVPLVTEKSGNGLLDLFTEGRHLVTYRKNDVEDASKKIETLLNDVALREAIGRQGRAEILAHHLPAHRADKVANALMHGVRIKRDPFALIANFTSLGIFLEDLGRNPLPAYTEALRLAEAGVTAGSEMTFELGQSILEALGHFDRVSKSTRADRLLEMLMQKYQTWFRR